MEKKKNRKRQQDKKMEKDAIDERQNKSRKTDAINKRCKKTKKYR